MQRFIKNNLSTIIGIPMLSLILPVLQALPEGFEGGLNYYLICAARSSIPTFFFWAGNVFIYDYAKTKMPGYELTGKRIAIQVVVSLVYCIIVTVVLTYVLMPANSHPPTIGDYWETFLIGYTLTIIISTIYECTYFFGQWKKAIVESEKLQKQNVIAQYETLKNQVNPHFLFNSLNALSSLVHTNPDKAEKFINEFSKVYRYLLDMRDKTIVTVKEELNFIHSYLFLQKIRYGNNLQVNIDIDATKLPWFVPPVALQILLENAIKHNIISSQYPLHIDIYDDDGYLVIKNNLQKRDEKLDSTGVGLINLKEKYKLICSRVPHFAVKEQMYIARIPLMQEDED